MQYEYHAIDIIMLSKADE